MVSTWPHADPLQAVRDTLDGADEAILATAFVDTRVVLMSRGQAGLPPNLNAENQQRSTEGTRSLGKQERAALRRSSDEARAAVVQRSAWAIATSPSLVSGL